MTANNMISLSIAIIAQNEEQNIQACLESVKWADEIIVVDAGSTDGTVEMCREYTDHIFEHEWQGFALQKKFALDQCSNDWVLSIDADERVRPELRDEIRKVLSENKGKDGYRIARRSYFLDKWIRYCGWYPGYQVRLFRRSKTSVSEARVHEGFLVDGQVGTLASDLDHYSHPTLEESLAKLNRYSTLEALDRLERKKVYWYDFLTHPLSEFLRKYFVQSGFRDGLYGLLLCWISAFLKMSMYMKLYNMQRMTPQEIKDLERKYR